MDEHTLEAALENVKAYDKVALTALFADFDPRDNAALDAIREEIADHDEQCSLSLDDGEVETECSEILKIYRIVEALHGAGLLREGATAVRKKKRERGNAQSSVESGDSADRIKEDARIIRLVSEEERLNGKRGALVRVRTARGKSGQFIGQRRKKHEQREMQSGLMDKLRKSKKTV